MGEAKRRGSLDRRKENPKGSDYKEKQVRLIRQSVPISDFVKVVSKGKK